MGLASGILFSPTSLRTELVMRPPFGLIGVSVSPKSLSMSITPLWKKLPTPLLARWALWSRIIKNLDVSTGPLFLHIIKDKFLLPIVKWGAEKSSGIVPCSWACLYPKCIQNQNRRSSSQVEWIQWVLLIYLRYSQIKMNELIETTDKETKNMY